MAVADRLDGIDPGDDLGRRGLVVPGVPAGEDAGIQRAADDNRCADLLAFGQQIIERRLLEQGVAAGEQESVPIAPIQSLEQHLPLVDADADRAHRAGRSQFFERSIAAVAQSAHHSRMGFPAVLHRADIVHVEDVDPCQPEPLKAVLERAHDSVIGVVVDRIEWQRMAAFSVVGRGRARTKQASDLCRQHPFVARHPAHGIADTTLGLADTVIWCRVDVGHSGRPGCTDDGFRLLPGDRDTTAAERRAAETQLRHFNRSPSNSSLLESGHRALSCCRFTSLRYGGEHTPFAPWSERRHAALCA